MYLNDGTHTYKFIVDGNWITDPANPDQMTDGTNNTNSVIRFGEAHTFRLDGFHDATNVYLAGSFNDWDGGEIAMERSFEGWQLNYILAPGTYEYKFVVDGNWISDPANTLKVGKGEFVNSVLYFKSNYTFTLRGFESAERVLISGSFNGWDEWNYQLELKDGIWSFPIYLNNGKHTYKFIVDGEWLLDPGNDLWEENEHGSGNSVLWINP